jgi:hypothetical protein
MIRAKMWMTPMIAIALTLGCSQSKDSSGGQGGTDGNPAALAEGKKYLLDSEPAGAKGAIEVRKESKNGDEVVVVGRVGGSSKPFTPGRATFLIVDPSLKPSTECDCPWDYCELSKEDLAAARINVKFVDAQGKTVQTGARDMFGIKELSTVVVKGKVSRDEKNVNVIATGIFVRKDRE